MRLPYVDKERWRRLTAIFAGGILSVLACARADAQLAMFTWRADDGSVYQVLQYTAGTDLDTGLDEIRVTSLAPLATGREAILCGTPIDDRRRTPLEAIAYGPQATHLPLDHAVKSSVIADATPPCFDPAARAGDGELCIGPGCDLDCRCPIGADCEGFSIDDGTPIAVATPDVPAASLATPLLLQQPLCRTFSGVSVSFGAVAQPTSRVPLCDPAPTDGFRLPGTPSRFAGGIAGTTIFFAFRIAPDGPFSVAAAGFGVDTDGENPYGCDAPGMVVAGVQSDLREPVVLPPGPPVQLEPEELRCQQAIGRAGRRLSAKWLRSLQFCREKILAGSWPIRASDCEQQPPIARALQAAQRMARAALGSCRRIDLARLLTCGDDIDALVDGAGSGCLVETHRRQALEMATTQYGF